MARQSARTRLQWLGEYIRRSWRESDASLRTGAVLMWVVAAAFTAGGIYLDRIGWWENKPFLTNLFTTVTGGLFGVPIVVVILQSLSNEKYTSYITEQQQRHEADLARAAEMQRRILAAADRNRTRRSEELVRDEIESFLQALDARLPEPTPQARQLLTDLEKASAHVPPGGSVTREAAAAMRSALREWNSIVLPTSLLAAQLDWQRLQALIPDSLLQIVGPEIADFTSRLVAVRDAEPDWYDEAIQRVGPSGDKTPRRSMVPLFVTGKEMLQRLLELRDALDELHDALPG